MISMGIHLTLKQYMSKRSTSSPPMIVFFNKIIRFLARLYTSLCRNLITGLQ